MAIHTILRGSKGKLFARSPIKSIVYLAVVILLASLLAWWNHNQNAPDTVFWGMVNNSLQTHSFSRTLIQEGELQRLEQVVSVQTSPQHVANSRSAITQGEPVTTRVVTESIGTPFVDYVRYADIQTTEKGPSGKPLDFSQIKNVWGMTEGSTTTTSGQLYTESVLGVVPIGSLSAGRQNTLIEQMKSSGAYKYEVASIERSGLMRRPHYTFNVQVNPVAYIATLKAFADDMGLTHLKNVDPSQYQSAQPVSVQIVVDGWSRQLTQVSYGGGTRVEKFNGFNNIKPLQSPPRDAIPISELQARLQTVQ